MINTQRMICANQAMLAQAFPFFDWEPPVLVDWLPWSHTFGCNHNFGIALTHGGTFYIDAGRPMPGGIAETVANLREIAPTVYFNVPKGFEALLPHLEADARLRAKFFSRLKMLFYAGAGLAPEIFHAYRAMAKRETGRDMPFVTGLGATETSPSALMCLMDVDEPGNIGLPMAGVELKLAPVEGKLEARVRAPNVTPGYWRDAELTREAFDEEGFYSFGDALRFAEPGDAGRRLPVRRPHRRGFQAGDRHLGQRRAAARRAVSALAPLAKDVVIAGHDRDDVAALDLPRSRRAAGCCAGCADDAAPTRRCARRSASGSPPWRRQATGSASRVERILLLAEPPSIDAGEITDKGSLNQRAVLQRRAAEAAALYDPESEAVIRAR